jgi:hypothetical protein
MTIVIFIAHLLAGYGDFFRINHYDEVSGLDPGRKGGFVFAKKYGCNVCIASKCLIFGVQQDPFEVKSLLLG